MLQASPNRGKLPPYLAPLPSKMERAEMVSPESVVRVRWGSGSFMALTAEKT